MAYPIEPVDVPVDTPMYRTNNFQVPQQQQQYPVYHKDLNLGWRATNNLPLMVLGNAAQQLKVLNVLQVLVGMEYFEPTFGSNVVFRLFQPSTTETEYLLEGDTIRALQRFMSDEIVLDPSQCRVSRMDDGETLMVTIVFYDKIRAAVETIGVQLSDTGFSLNGML